jgi:drug/metabolite transporter (DMT)-like permease
MNMRLELPEITTITSEIVLSLYPILIKVVDTGLDSQMLARTATFATLAFALVSRNQFLRILETPGLLVFLGLLNLVHIGTSYLAFQDLPAGPAMALFYTYPLWNLIFAWLIQGEAIELGVLPWFGLAFFGSLLIIRDIKEAFVPDPKQEKEDHTTRGIFAALAAALTEVAIYLVTRAYDQATPFPLEFQLYGGGLAWLIVGLLATGRSIVSDTRASTWIPLLAFNALIGFIGYSLRFWSVPRLSVSVFSILSFVGVFSAYAFGARFVNEIPSLQSLLGGALITGAIAGVRMKYTSLE